MPTPEPLERWAIDAAQLVADHPPLLVHPNKVAVYAVACPRGCVHTGRIQYSRWRSLDLPAELHWNRAATRIEARRGFFDYVPLVGSGAVEWHLNFADPRLFFGYGSGLFAQDEIQVAEHPALGSLREALEQSGRQPRTVENGMPTPVLVMGVERRCQVATDPNPGAGRPYGLYGMAFGAASPEAVRRATTAIEPPTITHLIAMAAPSGGSGAYTATELRHILVTAFAGFTAARLESHRAAGQNAAVVVHTGFWGCGAFGGNRILMAMLQILAANLAALDHLVLHTGSAEGRAAFDTALRTISRMLGDERRCRIVELIEMLDSCRFPWGESDGN